MLEARLAKGTLTGHLISQKSSARDLGSKKTPWDRFERDLFRGAKMFLFKSEFTERVTHTIKIGNKLKRRKEKTHQDPARHLPATRSNVF